MSISSDWEDYVQGIIKLVDSCTKHPHVLYASAAPRAKWQPWAGLLERLPESLLPAAIRKSSSTINRLLSTAGVLF